MNLKDHAMTELLYAGYAPDAEDRMDRQIFDSTIAIVEEFQKCGHSGGSAGAHTWMISQLLSYKSLGPVTDNPDNWVEVGPDIWQYSRQSCMFSEDGGKTYYSVDEFRSGWKRKLFGLRGKTYTSAPYKENK